MLDLRAMKMIAFGIYCGGSDSYNRPLKIIFHFYYFIFFLTLSQLHIISHIYIGDIVKQTHLFLCCIKSSTKM